MENFGGNGINQSIPLTSIAHSSTVSAMDGNSNLKQAFNLSAVREVSKKSENHELVT